MGHCEFKGKKYCIKLPSGSDTRCSWGSLQHLGKVTDISQNCMCIKTQYCIPLASMLHLHLKFRKKGLHITARVRSFSDSDNLSDKISVEILNPTEEYLGVVNDFDLTSKRT